MVLLPDEPYPFTAEDGPGEFPAQRVVLVSGRLLTWYGPSLATARADLLPPETAEVIRQITGNKQRLAWSLQTRHYGFDR